MASGQDRLLTRAARQRLPSRGRKGAVEKVVIMTSSKIGTEPDLRLTLWRMMTRIRRAEEAIAAMVETGEVRCPCHLYIGQEAIATGICEALEHADTVWGGHRSHGHYLAKGGSLEGLFAEILGKSTGCAGGRGGSMH